MKSIFTDLSKGDVQFLRRKSMAVASGNNIVYNFDETTISNAKKHLETLYTGNVTIPFTVKILTLNKMY